MSVEQQKFVLKRSRNLAARSRSALSRGVLVSTLWVLQAPGAVAQSAADRETARQLMDSGDARTEVGDFEQALGLYRGAHAIMNVPTTGFAVAETHARLGQLVEARDMALQVLRMPVPAPGQVEPEPFRLARAAADRLARELAQQIPILTIQIGPPAARDAASLRIDGTNVPAAAIELPHALNPGTHQLAVRAPGFEPRELHVPLVRAERRSLRVDLEPARPAPIVHGAEPRAVRPARKPAAASSATRAAPESLPWPVWVGASVGGAGLLVGSIAGVVSLDRASAAKKFCDGNVCTPEARSDRDQALRAARISNAGFLVAGLGAAVSLTSWWLSASERRRDPTPQALELRTLPDGAQLSWSRALW